MSDRDLMEFRQFLREVVRVLRMPTRDLERRLGIGNGMLARLLDGRLQIRLHHVLTLADILKVPPGELLAFGCQEATRKAQYRMADWMPVSGPARQNNPLPATVEELRDLIREAVREQMDERRTAEEAAPSPPPSGKVATPS